MSRPAGADEDSPRFRAVVSPSAAERLACARDAVHACAPGARILIIGSSRGAADDFARDVARGAQATFGIERLSLTQCAAKSAIVALAARQVTPGSALGTEAIAARAVFDALQDASLRYFTPVAPTPGFPKALARTLQELRLGGVGAATVSPSGPAGQDVASLLERFEAGCAAAASSDRTDLFLTAASVLRSSLAAPYQLVVFLDVPVHDAAERDLVAAVTDRAVAALATVPHGDRETIEHVAAIGAVVDALAGNPTPAHAAADDLSLLRRHLFNTDEAPPVRALDGSLEVFSAPGEGRECVEIARRVLMHARAGVRFDEIAILVRAPHTYLGLLEHAMRRADVPAWFERGTKRPHPAGRAFLALLACAGERLSAARFAEYLSLAQVPALGQTLAVGDQPPAGPSASAAGPLVGGTPWVRPSDEAFGASSESATAADDEEVEEIDASGPDSPSVAGSLRAPWRWEALLVEAAVVGGDAARWRRRLDGKTAELARQIEEARREEGPDGGRVQSLRRTRGQLEHLRTFALPIVEELASWPPRATWGGWLERFTRLAPRVLRAPAQVLRVLADLRPMGVVGPIDLDEARRVLSERLLMLEAEPPARRFGRIFIGTPHQARGRCFRVVFVPGLAERLFPQRPHEDPLLLDDARVTASPALRTQPRRLAAERLLLQLAAGAASERLYVSYPRIELTESRARVPSFYALDLMRAATGSVPDYERLETQARETGRATLAWPAPPAPEDAIDDLEHDLAVVRRLLDETDRDTVRGHAHYLLKLNACLRRSVIGRWSRGGNRWSVSDGLIRVTDDTREMLAAQRLTARPYSVSALQRFSSCPYQFLLAGVYRLQPIEQPEPLQRMDPLTRGSLFHSMQARFLRALEERGQLPVTEATLPEAALALDETISAVAERAHEDLAPAVERMWNDQIASIRRDLHGWLQYLSRDGAEWHPRYFEFAFGSVPGERDPDSVRNDVQLEGGFRLRGAVDLIEAHRSLETLRVTDHKTGRKPDRIEKVIVGGGSVLQPVLYAMAVEQALGRPVSVGRLFYCTSTGGYSEHPIPLNGQTRASGREVLEVIDRAIEGGFLAAAPAEEACGRCDFRPVCGPDVFRRVSRKPQDRLADLLALRSRP